MVLKGAPLPEDIVKIGAEESDLEGSEARGCRNEEGRDLVSAAKHSTGSREVPEAARMELKNLSNDMNVYASGLEELLRSIEEKLNGIPYIDILRPLKGSGW